MKNEKKVRYISVPFDRPAPFVKMIEERGLLDKQKDKILEIGAGNLRNALYLLSEGYKIEAFEIKETYERYKNRYEEFRKLGGTYYIDNFPSTQYSVILLIFVIETILLKKKRKEILKKCKYLLTNKGRLFICLRGLKDLSKMDLTNKKYKDGYLTSKQTFVKPFTVKDAVNLLKSSGFSSIKILNKNKKNPKYVKIITFKD